MTVVKAPDISLIGHTFQALADRHSAGQDPLDYFMDLIIQYDTDLVWKCTAANHRDKIRVGLLAHKATIPGFNDSGAHNVNMAFHDGSLQALRQAQDYPDILPIEKAIHRLTKLPADWLGIDAGSIEVGRRADICVLDPSQLQTGLTEEPIEDYHPSLKGSFRYVKRSDGVVNHVFVNGEEVFNDQAGFSDTVGKKATRTIIKKSAQSMITFDEWKDRAQYFRYKDYDIAYWTAGEGVPLLLIHGFPTASWDWYKIWDELASRFKVYALDMLGFGYSDKPTDYTYSLTDQAILHEAFLNEFNIQKAHLLVHDYGVSVAQEIIASFHERGDKGFQILSCCFLNGGLFPHLHHARPIQKLLISPFGSILNRFLNKNSLRKNFRKIYGKNKPTEQDIDQFYQLMTYKDGIRNTYKLMRYIINRRENAERWKSALTEAQIPLHFINGPLDPVSGRHLAKYCKALLPNREVIILEGVGHYPHDEAPREVLDAYWKFIDGIESK